MTADDVDSYMRAIRNAQALIVTSFRLEASLPWADATGDLDCFDIRQAARRLVVRWQREIAHACGPWFGEGRS